MIISPMHWLLQFDCLFLSMQVWLNYITPQNSEVQSIMKGNDKNA